MLLSLTIDLIAKETLPGSAFPCDANFAPFASTSKRDISEASTSYPASLILRIASAGTPSTPIPAAGRR